jgi:CBS domain containing-hemolysin-like protein
VPRPGESFTVEPFRVVVERVTGRRVRRVYFERLDPARDEAAAAGSVSPADGADR